MQAPHPDWLRPDWPAPAQVQALCTTRTGGYSRAPFDSLNLGDHVGDDLQAVQANRQRLQAALRGVRPVFLQQVHGTQVVDLHPGLADGAVADACVSSTPGLACTIMVADCLPLLLTNRHQAQAATQSIASGVAGQTLAWLGPCIGPQAFEVGSEVRDAFCAHDVAAAQHFSEHAPGKFLANLAALARQRLQALGIAQVYGNDGSPGWCTVSQPSRFFSHRRDSRALGGSGRMAACIWLD